VDWHSQASIAPSGAALQPGLLCSIPPGGHDHLFGHGFGRLREPIWTEWTGWTERSEWTLAQTIKPQRSRRTREENAKGYFFACSSRSSRLIVCAKVHSVHLGSVA